MATTVIWLLRNVHLFNNYLERRETQQLQKILPYVQFAGPSMVKSHKLKLFTNTYMQGIYNTPRRANNPILRNHQNVRSADLRGFMGLRAYKFRYTGKSYRVIHQHPILFLKFNRAHRTTLVTKDCNIFMFRRLWFKIRTGTPHLERMHFLKTIYTVRKRNLFTKRGLWFTKRMSWKKRGKISAYR